MNIEAKIQKEVPLAALSTFRVGGPAKYFAVITGKAELAAAFDWAKEKKEPVVWLGGMSNVLISDRGFDGLVIKLGNNQVRVKGARIEAEAGAELSQAVNQATAYGLSGLEWASGIPGSVGGAVRGNAGAFGLSLGDSVETIQAYSREKNEFKILSQKDCRFAYRDSLFKSDKQYIIWQATLKLTAKLSSVVKEDAIKNLDHRLKTQPRLPSAGCVFKNLLVANMDKNDELYATALKENAIKGEKIPAGWVINQLDLGGKTIGGAKVSLEHNNFIVNSGKATADDIITLISLIKQKVRTAYKINLEEEIEFIGF